MRINYIFYCLICAIMAVTPLSLLAQNNSTNPVSFSLQAGAHGGAWFGSLYQSGFFGGEIGALGRIPSFSSSVQIYLGGTFHKFDKSGSQIDRLYAVPITRRIPVARGSEFLYDLGGNINRSDTYTYTSYSSAISQAYRFDLGVSVDIAHGISALTTVGIGGLQEQRTDVNYAITMFAKQEDVRDQFISRTDWHTAFTIRERIALNFDPVVFGVEGSYGVNALSNGWAVGLFLGVQF
jgi:hypothetical protein